MLKMSLTVRSMKNVTVLMEDGAFAVFSRPHPGNLTAQESLSPYVRPVPNQTLF